jgi:hypothetical protein
VSEWRLRRTAPQWRRKAFQAGPGGNGRVQIVRCPACIAVGSFFVTANIGRASGEALLRRNFRDNDCGGDEARMELAYLSDSPMF